LTGWPEKKRGRSGFVSGRLAAAMAAPLMRLLVKVIRDAGQIPTLGGIEFAQELVAAMDLYRAAKNDRSLALFVEDMRAALQRSP
jgi:hypothetical protein